MSQVFNGYGGEPDPDQSPLAPYDVVSGQEMAESYEFERDVARELSPWLAVSSAQRFAWLAALGLVASLSLRMLNLALPVLCCCGVAAALYLLLTRLRRQQPHWPVWGGASVALVLTLVDRLYWFPVAAVLAVGAALGLLALLVWLRCRRAESLGTPGGAFGSQARQSSGNRPEVVHSIRYEDYRL